MAEGSICRNCFHSYVCEQFNEHRDSGWDNKKCHFFNDHFVSTTDVVEVVRCKDCIYNNSSPELKSAIWCMKHAFYLKTGPMGFCSCGKRRESEEQK